MGLAVLEVRHLAKSFKKNFWQSPIKVLKDLNFSINKGEAVGFLGANGAGKTTTFKCLLGLLKKDSGKALFFGEPLSHNSKKRIGFLPERPVFYEELTAFECLHFYGSLSQIPPSALKIKIDQGLKSLKLYSRRHDKLKNFSKGMLQKIGLLQALIHEPELLILDEPFSGLDPAGRFATAELLESAREKGAALFVSSHIFQDLERLCQRFLIIKEGGIVFDGGFEALQKNRPGRAKHFVSVERPKALLKPSLFGKKPKRDQKAYS